MSRHLFVPAHYLFYCLRRNINCRKLDVNYSLIFYSEFLLTIELTPKMEVVTSRNCATRYRFASVRSPTGGTQKPANANTTAEMKDAVAIRACN